MRSHWKGQLTVALMSIPIQLFKAFEEPKKFPFKQLHAGPALGKLKGRCGGSVGVFNYCKQCEAEHLDEKEGDIEKGYEWEKGQFVPVTKDDVEKVKLPSSKAIEVVACVKSDEIPIPFYEQPFYAGTDEAGEVAFALFREALRSKGLVAIGRQVKSGREELLALRPYGQALMVQYLRYKHEVRDVADVPGTPAVPVEAKSLKLAQQLVSGLAMPFEKFEAHDRFVESMEAMIEAKRKGKKFTMPAAPVPSTSGLLDALEKSIAATQRKPVQAVGRKQAARNQKRKRAA